MWVEESGGERINEVRAAEALATGAEIVAVACPFCMQMFEAGLKSLPVEVEEGKQVFDLAELLVRSGVRAKEGSPPAPPGSPGAGEDPLQEGR